MSYLKIECPFTYEISLLPAMIVIHLSSQMSAIFYFSLISSPLDLESVYGHIIRSCKYHLLNIYHFPTCTELGMLNDNMSCSFRTGRVWSAKVSSSGRNLSSGLTSWLSFNSGPSQIYIQTGTAREISTRKNKQSV